VNKKNIITIITLIISAILISILTTIDGIFDEVMFQIVVTLSITLVMLYKRKNIKRFKLIYNIVLIILLLMSTIFIISFMHSIITCFISTSCYNNVSSNFEIILLTIIFTLTLIQIVDYKIEKIKINHILTWIVSAIVVVIYLRYHYDADFIHNYMYQNQFEIQNSYIYVTQNYCPLSIIYGSLLIHYLINRKQVQ